MYVDLHAYDNDHQSVETLIRRAELIDEYMYCPPSAFLDGETILVNLTAAANVSIL